MGYTPPQLEVRKITGGYALYPPNSTTTDDLEIYANTTDTKPVITIQGTNNIMLDVALNQGILIKDNGVTKLTLTENANGMSLTAADNIDLYLAIGGTGSVKFGTYTAGAAADSTGYITIKDAGGTVRKLMVQA